LAADPTTGQYKGTLPPGAYQVTANAQNYKPQVKIAQIEKGLPTLVNFVLEPEVEEVKEGALAGRVVDPKKQPLPGVISFEGADIPNVVASPATGEFYLKLNPGSYSVRAAAQGYKSQLKVVRIAAGKKTIAEFVLEPLTKAKLTEKKIEITETIHFESGKAVILPESYGLLDEVADILQSNPTLSILIEGHTDSVGSDSYNLRLSQSRANSVMQYLIQRGVSPNRLKAVGYGESRPIANNSTAEGRARNRRVEFTIIRR
jgi:outer membrane protein OmpA-like peptidoglycan-associated protein